MSDTTQHTPADVREPTDAQIDVWSIIRSALSRAFALSRPWSVVDRPRVTSEVAVARLDAIATDCAREVLAALRSEAQGEADAVRRTWELAVRRAYGCLDYCGGYRGAELKAFHSGIKTVIRALEAGPDTVDTQTAALDRIGAALRGEVGGE